MPDPVITGQREAISRDDLESLKFLLNELQKAEHAVQSLQRHIGAKYQVKNGESIDLADGGTIIRAEKVKGGQSEN